MLAVANNGSKGTRHQAWVKSRQTRWTRLSTDGLQYGCSKQDLGLLRDPPITLPSRATVRLQAKDAEREGFEPSRRLNTAYAISNPKKGR